MTRRDGQITIIQFTRRTGLHPLEPSSYTSVPPSPAMPWRLAIGSPEFGTGDVLQSGSDLEARIGTTGRTGLDLPYWAFAWAGGQALARYLLDHPETVRGRPVTDIASGSGLVAI